MKDWKETITLPTEEEHNKFLKNLKPTTMTNNDREWGILACLFKATVEQQAMLIGVPQQRAKVIFNRWVKEGNNLLKLIEEATDNDQLEIVTSTIENSINELRTSSNKV